MARNRLYTSHNGKGGRVSEDEWIVISRFVSKFLDQKVEEVLNLL
jgi:hypothetical protein